MSLPHALLTALVERPASGSDLAARFDRSIGYFWNASHQQIYRELARMEAAGLIQSLPEETGRGRKRAYRIEPAGRAELDRWIGEPDRPSPLRDELMVRLWAEAVVGPAGLGAAIGERRARHEAQLALYERLMARDFPDTPTDRATALRRLVLQSGLDYERLWVEILTEAEGLLAEG